jgi:3-methylfumaryl-CoA hydratase
MSIMSMQPPAGGVVREEVIAPEPAEALANLLGVEVPRSVLPPTWHWVYLLERHRSADLGPDGHPTSGVPAPPGPGLKRMFAGGRVTTARPLRIGEPATRVTWVTRTAEKVGRSGPLTFLTLRSEISQGGAVAIAEESDLVYRAADASAPTAGTPAEEPAAGPRLRLDVDEAFLFRFSALTYNAHRIHYDLEWARAEGYTGLVVHGPLQALMMAEFARRHGEGLVGRTFAYRLVAPMTGPQALTVLAGPDGARVLDAAGRVTARGQLTLTPGNVAGS